MTRAPKGMARRATAAVVTNDSGSAANITADQPSLVVESLSYRYGSRIAVNDLSFAVSEGEVFVLLGPNGGGKTTLFRVLSTLLPCQAGHVTIFGHDLSSQAARVRHQLGVVFQSPSLDKKLTRFRKHAASGGAVWNVSKLFRRAAGAAARSAWSGGSKERFSGNTVGRITPKVRAGQSTAAWSKTSVDG